MFPFRVLLAAVPTVLTLMPVWAAPSFRADKNYPEIGLRMRTLGGSLPEPLPTHKTYSYTFKRGSDSYKKDLALHENLWVYSGGIGRSPSV